MSVELCEGHKEGVERRRLIQSKYGGNFLLDVECEVLERWYYSLLKRTKGL
jgi:hypothetical protein